MWKEENKKRYIEWYNRTLSMTDMPSDRKTAVSHKYAISSNTNDAALFA